MNLTAASRQTADWIRQRIKVHGIFCLFCAVVILAQAAFVWLYVGAENTLYFWDHAMYQNMTRYMYYLTENNSSYGYSYLRQTLASNYPALFALPHLITFDWFGDSRRVFILTNFFFYFVPQELAIALILRRGLGFPFGRSLLFVAAACLLIPPFWIPLLQGYPDNVSEAFLLFGFLFTLSPKKNWKNMLATGISFGLAILFRRHYAYAILPLYAVAGLWDLVPALRAKQALQSAKIVALYLFSGIIAATVIGLAAPVYFENMLKINFVELYNSYKVDAGSFFRFALNNFGIALAGVAAFGLLVSARTEDLSRRVLAWVALWLVCWIFGAAQTGTHYVLQLLPFATLVGFAGLWHEMRKWPPLRQAAAAAPIVFFLAANVSYALWFAPEGVVPNWRGNPMVVSAPRPPVVREDKNTLIELADYLANSAGSEDRILVVGSSFDFNQDILRAAYTDVLLDAAALRHFLHAPEIDRVQAPPYEVYEAATIFVVPNIAQYHLNPQGQKVVTALSQLFPPKGPAAKLFEKDAKEFSLKNGVKISIWRRTKPWTVPALSQAMRIIRNVTGDDL
jgi:hypothetical protein